MTQLLAASVAQWSAAGIKPANEDACGYHIPAGDLLTTKGISIVIADGMSGSEAGKEASHACVQGFLSDYYSTPESWTVKTAGWKVLGALNRWLHGQGERLHGSAKGMVTTLSTLIVKSSTAYLFHVGDTRVYRLRDHELERLTRDHRIQVNAEKNYLSRALGIELNIEIDYRSTPVEADDTFLLTTDGIHDFLDDHKLLQIIEQHGADMQYTCQALVEAALAAGSNDNLTAQLVHIEHLPDQDKDSVYQQLTELPFPPPMEPGMRLDGYRILRELHASKRSELYLALDEDSGQQMVIKTPSVNYEDDPAYIELFLHEGWVGRRIDNSHVAHMPEQKRQRSFLYHVIEYIDGQTLRQWMHDHPLPSLSEVRAIIEQIVIGLRAFHRMEMIHQDLKPDNIMIDKHGIVKLIDFGSTKIAGIEEIASPVERPTLLGTEHYTAPEYLQGYAPSNRSDIYSLGVITYEMLTGRLPYGEASESRHRRPAYTPATRYNAAIPAWLDGTLHKAVQRETLRRYDTLSEFVYDLSHPNPQFIRQEGRPLIERHPVAFWRTATLLVLAINLVLLFLLLR